MFTIRPATRGCGCSCGPRGCADANAGVAGAKHCGRPGQCR